MQMSALHPDQLKGLSGKWAGDSDSGEQPGQGCGRRCRVGQEASRWELTEGQGLADSGRRPELCCPCGSHQPCVATGP